MRKFPALLISVLILSIALSIWTSARADEAVQDNPKELKKAFEISLFQALGRLEDIRKKRTYRMRGVNDSIAKTTQAVESLEKSNDYEKAEALLHEANKIHPDNPLAELVLADVLDARGKTDEASQAYLQFLRKAARASSLSQAVMTYENRLIFSQYVRARLKARGLIAPAPQGEKELPLLNQLSWEKDSWLRIFVATGLPFMIMLGLPFLLIRRMIIDIVRPASFDAFVTKIYITLVIGYLIWLGHLFLELPPLIEPAEREIALIILAEILIVVGFHGRDIYVLEQKKRSDPTVMACPYCRKLIQKLLANCPYCKKGL